MEIIIVFNHDDEDEDDDNDEDDDDDDDNDDDDNDVDVQELCPRLVCSLAEAELTKFRLAFHLNSKLDDAFKDFDRDDDDNVDFFAPKLLSFDGHEKEDRYEKG